MYNGGVHGNLQCIQKGGNNCKCDIRELASLVQVTVSAPVVQDGEFGRRYTYDMYCYRRRTECAPE